VLFLPVILFLPQCGVGGKGVYVCVMCNVVFNRLSFQVMVVAMALGFLLNYARSEW